MNIEERRLIKRNLDILFRRKGIIAVSLLLGITLGLAMYLYLPKVYSCTALIKYQRQTVNPTAMSPDDIRTKTRDVVDTVSQEIMSRSSLESIIKEFDLYPEMRQDSPMEDVVDLMREKHIRTKLLEGGDVFEVSFQGGDQDKVLRVTNTLAAKFIEENLRFRQELASQTSTYIKDELEMAKNALDKKEQIMRDYKLEHYNEMPDQLANNMSRLNALQEQYQNNQVSIHELERTRLMVQEQISLRKNLLAQVSSPVSPASMQTATANSELQNALQVRQRLQSLQTRYTDKHPEIKRLKKILRDLEGQHGSTQAADADQKAPDSKNASLQLDPELQQLEKQLNDVELNIARLKDEREVLARQIEKYEKWIEAAPVREAEWSALTRDYEQLNDHYQKLVTQSLQAESAQTLENQLKGSQFKIIDAAHFPEKPFRPDFKKIMLAAFGASLAFGVILVFSLELLGTSFRDPEEIESYLKVPVVCAIPAIRTRREVIRKKIRHLAGSMALLLAFAAIVAAAGYFWKQGMIVL